MRAFISIEIPEEIKREIVELQKRILSKNLFEGKLTEKENLHLTLKFLGEISDEKVEKVRGKLKELKFSKFKVKIADVGAFSKDFVKIIWVSLDGNGVIKLQKEIDNALGDLFEKETRFMSHMTIARVKNVKDKKKLIDFLSDLKIDGEFEVNKFMLRNSELRPEGPIYTTIEKFNLV